MRRLGYALKAVLAVDYFLIAASGLFLLWGDEEVAVLLLAVTGAIALVWFPVGIWWALR